MRFSNSTLGSARVLAACCVAFATAGLAAARSAPALSEFLIATGWAATNLADASLANALAQAHFNAVLWPQDKLEVCRAAGLKLMVEDAKTQDAARLGKDPVVWGYHVADEPKAPAFAALAREVEELRQADSRHPANINMLCFGGELLRDYLRIVRPDILSYDHYQWWWGSHSHFEKLEQHRAAALSAGIPLTCWVEVNANPNMEWGGEQGCDPDNAVKLRQSVYTSLAYGVRGIQWFSAAQLFKPGSTDLNECGLEVAALNAELEKLGPTLMRLHSVDVFHTQPLPRRTCESQHDHWAQVLGDELMWGMFKDEADTDYLMVVNRDIRQRRQATVQFQRAGYGRKVKEVFRFDRATGRWVGLSSRVRVLFVVNLAPGDGQLYKVLKEDAVGGK